VGTVAAKNQDTSHSSSHFHLSFFLSLLLISGSERFELRASLLQRFIVLLRQTIGHTGQEIYRCENHKSTQTSIRIRVPLRIRTRHPTVFQWHKTMCHRPQQKQAKNVLRQSLLLPRCLGIPLMASPHSCRLLRNTVVYGNIFP
jgi:hypothetical protein